MKKRLSLILVLLISQLVLAGLYTTVYYADETTPLELVDPCVPYVYQDIMVGTKLTIIVSSDVGGVWYDDKNNGYFYDSDLSIFGDYMNYGVLSGRDCGEKLGYECSCLDAAGTDPLVLKWLGVPYYQGFGLYPDLDPVPGDWFVIDYTAIKSGICKVNFYDRSVDFNDPVYYHVFNQIPTRDFDDNTVVDFNDFCIFASHWQETGITDPNMCQRTDINEDGAVDSEDLGLFADYWLYGIQ